jgi:hypothetical protein
MKTKSWIGGLVAVVALGIALLGILSAAENPTVALITKAVQDVSRKSPAVDWTKAAKGDPLVSGDEIRTGEKSLAVVKFIDNSIVRVREQSQITISGESGGPKSLSKDVHITRGAIGFDIRKQKQNEQFQFTSPTSVASIRGTVGSIAGGDTLIVVEGLVNLKNLISNKDVNVPAGFIGFSFQDGTLTTRPATPAELAGATNLAGDGTSNDINIELKDGKGIKKDLKLKFKK